MAWQQPGQQQLRPTGYFAAQWSSCHTLARILLLPCCRDLLQIHWPDRYVPLFGELCDWRAAWPGRTSSRMHGSVCVVCVAD